MGWPSATAGCQRPATSGTGQSWSWGAPISLKVQGGDFTGAIYRNAEGDIHADVMIGGHLATAKVDRVYAEVQIAGTLSKRFKTSSRIDRDDLLDEASIELHNDLAVSGRLMFSALGPRARIIGGRYASKINQIPLIPTVALFPLTE